MTAPYCTACDPNPAFAGDMHGFAIAHTCEKWKGLTDLGVLDKMRAERQRTIQWNCWGHDIAPHRKCVAKAYEYVAAEAVAL